MSEPLIHDPGNETTIEHVYVYLSIDAEGRNGIVATSMGPLGSTPMVTGSPRVAELMKPMAEQVARLTGKTVALFSFKRDAQLWQSDDVVA